MINRQKKVKEYIEKFYLENKYPPSVRDIQSELNIPSTSTVHSDIKALAARGEIEIRGVHPIPVFTDDFTKIFLASL